MSVYEYTDPIDLKKLVLYTPKSTQGGGYHAKIKLTNDNLLLQTPRIKIKNGFHKTGKRLYCDLLINREHLEFINYLKKIEQTVINLVYNKGNDWFSSKPSYDDISERWTSMFKIYKNINTLVRTLVEKNEKNVELKVWDENQKEISYEDLNEDDDVICIFHISNIRFSSTSFQIDIILKQMMRFKKKNENKCLIKGMNTAFLDINNKLNHLEDLENTDKNSTIETTDSENEYTDEDDEEDEDDEDEYDEDDEDEDEDDQEEYDEDEYTDEDEGDEYDEEEDDDNNEDISNNVLMVEKKEKVVDNEIKKDIEKEEVINEINEVKKKNNENNLEKSLKDLEEVDLNIDNNLDIKKLKKPKDVYIGIYNKALAKAREAKKMAIKEYLNAKNIKKQYLLDDVESSDGEDLETFN